MTENESKIENKPKIDIDELEADLSNLEKEYERIKKLEKHKKWKILVEEAKKYAGSSLSRLYDSLAKSKIMEKENPRNTTIIAFAYAVKCIERKDYFYGIYGFKEKIGKTEKSGINKIIFLRNIFLLKTIF
ncbi:MAG: hypothetical protein QXD48_00705 [Candidatus Aenigmatarchaeota archaeon]